VGPLALQEVGGPVRYVPFAPLTTEIGLPIQDSARPWSRRRLSHYHLISPPSTADFPKRLRQLAPILGPPGNCCSGERHEASDFPCFLPPPHAIVVPTVEHHWSRVTRNHANDSLPRNELPAEIPALARRISNRHKFTFCNFSFSRRSVLHSPASNFQSLASKLLAFALTPPKSSTSQFLIDNFCGDFTPVFHPSLATNHSPLHSNRPAPRLEMPVSYRKQNIGPISNRPKFAVCNSFLSRRVSTLSAIPAAARTIRPSSHSPLVTRHSSFSCPCIRKVAQFISREEEARCPFSWPRA
jgi:hypothetical protein